jgi:WD40 repeat protein
MTDKEKRELAADIGDRALDVDGALLREAFILGKCGGDLELAQYVRKYIADYKEVLATRSKSGPKPPEAPKKPAPQGPAKFQEIVIDGRYKLIRSLGAGGMGKVFKATDLKTGKPVAIKFIRSAQAAGENNRMRFVREARAAARLHHPNLVAVHDIGQFKGALYIVMEYVRGVPLNNHVAVQGSIPLRTKLSIMAQVADALAYAHRQGIIHRDIKPANILVLSDQSVKVVDLGIAEQSDLPNSLVEGGGTVLFSSPEQLQRKHLDPRSDIWSTGVTFYLFLTGRLPFPGVPHVLCAPLPVLPPETPLASELNAILARALAKDPEMRYPKAEDLGTDLRSLLEVWDRTHVSADFTQPVEQESSESAYVLPELNFSIAPAGELTAREGALNKWNGRRQKLLECVSPPMLFAVALVMWGAFSTLHTYDMRTPAVFEFRPTGVSDARPALLGAAVLVTLPLLALCWAAGYLLCCVLNNLFRCPNCSQPMRRTAIWTRLCKSREEVIFGYRDCMAALKHGLWEDAAKLLTIHGSEHSTENSSRFMTPARYHLKFFECRGCGLHAARFTADEMIEGNWEEQPKSGEVHWGTATARPSFGSRLASAPRAYLRLLPDSVESLRINRALLSGVVAAACLGLTLGGIAAAFEWGRAQKQAVSVKREARHKLLAQATAAYISRPDQSLAYLAKALRMTIAGSNNGFKDPDATIYDSWITRTLTSRTWPNGIGSNRSRERMSNSGAATPEPRSLQHNEEVRSAVFSPDGRRVVTASDDHTARVWDVETGKPVGPPFVHADAVSFALFSPDGRRVVTASADRTARLWDVDTGQPVGPPLAHDGSVTSAAFSPDGRRLVTASHSVTRVWDTATGRQVGPVLKHDRTVTITSASFHPDGHRIVTASRESTGHIVWDLDTGKPAGPLLQRSRYVDTAAFSPDGGRLVTASGRTVQVWDAQTGRPVRRPFEHRSSVTSIAFSPDGRRVVTATSDPVVQVWDIETGRIGTPFPHVGTVSSAVFSPDGRRIVTAAYPGITIFDVETFEQVGPAFPRNHFIYSVFFSPDGRRIVTASTDHVAQIWVVMAGLRNREDAVQLADLAEVAGGYRIDDSGALVAIPAQDRTNRLQALRRANAFPSLHLFLE